MVSHHRSPAALGAVAFLLALPGGAVASPVTDALPAIRGVDHEGKGNAAAAKAWGVIAAAEAAALPDILAGMDGANPIAANWLRSAIDAVVTKAGGSAKLPVDSLVRFLADTKHDPRARRLAFDLVRGADAARADKLLDGMVEDPSVELRRDAVAKVIARADALKTGEKKEEALAAYQKAFSASRNVEQIQALATTIRDLGGTVDLTGHFGFLRGWQIVGPFDNTEGKGFATVYPPEEKLDLSAALDGKAGKVSWQPVETGDEYGVVNVNLSYPPPPPPADAKPADSESKEGLKGVIAYAVTEFVSAEDRPAGAGRGSRTCRSKTHSTRRGMLRPVGPGALAARIRAWRGPGVRRLWWQPLRLPRTTWLATRPPPTTGFRAVSPRHR